MHCCIVLAGPGKDYFGLVRNPRSKLYSPRLIPPIRVICKHICSNRHYACRHCAQYGGEQCLDCLLHATSPQLQPFSRPRNNPERRWQMCIYIYIIYLFPEFCARYPLFHTYTDICTCICSITYLPCTYVRRDICTHAPPKSYNRGPRPEFGGEELSEELLNLNEACNRSFLFKFQGRVQGRVGFRV